MADYPVRRHRFSIQVFLSVLGLLVSACSLSQRIEDRIVEDGARGAVALQHVDDVLFKSAHPVSVSPQLVTQILRGAQALPDDASTPMYVFSADEAEFLSPLISTALSQATEKQLVTFRIVRGKNVEEAIGGTVYIRGRLLHFALIYYDANLDRRGPGEKQDPASRDLGEPVPSQLAFIPETDQRSSIDEHRAVVTPPPLGTLVVDYEMFSEELDLPSPTAQSPSLPVGSLPCPQADIQSASRDNGVTAVHETPSHDDGEHTQALKKLVCEQAIELDALKKNMRVLRHMLSKIEAQTPRATKPEAVPLPYWRSLNRVRYSIPDPSCNSIFIPLHCRSGWLLDGLKKEYN